MPDNNESISDESLEAGPPDGVGGIPLARPVTWMSDGYSTGGHEILLATSSRGSAWVDLIWVSVLVLGVQMLMEVSLSLFFELDRGAGSFSEDYPGSGPVAFDRAAFYPALGMRSVGCLAVVAFVVRFRGQRAATLGLNLSRWKSDIGVGVGSTVAIYLLILVTTPPMMIVFPDTMKLLEENAQQILSRVPKLHPIGLVGVSMVIGIYEEVLFRGFLMTRLRRAMGSWTMAVIVSTTVFAALHLADQTPPAVVWVTLLSLLFSLVTIWRKSVLPAIVGHFLFDMSQLLHLYVRVGDEWS